MQNLVRKLSGIFEWGSQNGKRSPSEGVDLQYPQQPRTEGSMSLSSVLDVGIFFVVNVESFKRVSFSNFRREGSKYLVWAEIRSVCPNAFTGDCEVEEFMVKRNDVRDRREESESLLRCLIKAHRAWEARFGRM